MLDAVQMARELELLAKLHGQQKRDAAQRNRARFPAAAEGLDLLRREFPNARVVYAENAQGETIGKRDTLKPGERWCRIYWNGVEK